MMKIPSETKPALWGAAGGAAALAIIGFTWGGWVTHKTATYQADRKADAAVVAALAPICVNSFQQNNNATANLVALKKVDTWRQGNFVASGGWATMPGAKEPNSSVAEACAKLLEDQKL
jgi:hypothetical protein